MVTRVGESVDVLLASWLLCWIQPNSGAGWKISHTDENSSSGIRYNWNRPPVFVGRCFCSYLDYEQQHSREACLQLTYFSPTNVFKSVMFLQFRKDKRKFKTSNCSHKHQDKDNKISFISINGSIRHRRNLLCDVLHNWLAADNKQQSFKTKILMITANDDWDQ